MKLYIKRIRNLPSMETYWRSILKDEEWGEGGFIFVGLYGSWNEALEHGCIAYRFANTNIPVLKYGRKVKR